MRDDYDELVATTASVLAVAPESRDAVARFIRQHPVPFPIVSDADHHVFDAYDVASRASSLGQRPAVFVIGPDGVVRFDSVGTQQWQIPTNRRVLRVLATLTRPPEPGS